MNGWGFSPSLCTYGPSWARRPAAGRRCPPHCMPTNGYVWGRIPPAGSVLREREALVARGTPVRIHVGKCSGSLCPRSVPERITARDRSTRRGRKPGSAHRDSCGSHAGCVPFSETSLILFSPKSNYHWRWTRVKVISTQDKRKQWVFAWCWTSVCDAGPRSGKHWLKVSCQLGWNK